MPRRAERLRHRLAERDAEILDGVMLIDVEIAARVDRQVERAVAREQLQHVVEKADAGPHLIPALAVQAERQRDLRLGRRRSITARRTDLLHHRDGALRVLDDAGRDAERSGAARLGRAIAQVDAFRERALDERVGPVAGADEHEVGLARHVRRPSRSHAA
jgi:hypothetical protein